jgi:Ti-type conjugative transfer relaxase TraA
MRSPELVRLEDDHARTRYTTRTQQTIEARLAANAARLAGGLAHGVPTSLITTALAPYAAADQSGPREALKHLLDGRGLSMVVGYAGAGKSTLMRAAADAWRGAGYRVRGLALAGRAAENLEADSGIPSGTIAAFLMALDSGAVSLSPRDIVVVDEAGMVASHQMDRILDAAASAGAKIVLVGDPQQLQAIEAGGPFRYLVEHYYHATLSTVWRQKHEWMRTATRHLAECRTDIAISAYEHAGMVMPHKTREDTVAAILDMYLANRDSGRSQMILTATNADARMINEAARLRMHAIGALGPDHILDTVDGPASFASGDRLVFRRNDRRLGVKNGTTGTVVEITGTRIAVMIDGRPDAVVIDAGTYPHLSHGYALTIHKAQGATVDRAYVLAAPNMDRHSAYVALSRHRERVSLHWSSDVFANRAALGRALSRERLKDVTLDYKETVAQAVTAVMDTARKATNAGPEIDAWTGLYARQRREAGAYSGMSLIRRGFWMAANLDRFVKAGVLTLAKLHERERAAFAMSRKRQSSSTVAPAADIVADRDAPRSHADGAGRRSVNPAPAQKPTTP